MGTRKGTLYNFGVSLFRHLTGFYPERFRRKFTGEMYAVLLQRLEDANNEGGVAIPACIFHESTALMASIIKEHWHERWGLKDVRMVGEEKLNREIGRIFLKRRLKSAVKVILPLVGFIVLLNACSYAYAGLQIAQAKNLGMFPTLEDAVYGTSYAESIIRVDINHSEPCFSDGKYPFVMCVTTTVFNEPIHTGPQHKNSSGQSAYFHLKEGWVCMPGENFTGFIAKVVERLGMQFRGD
jgi:hypothetical protein